MGKDMKMYVSHVNAYQRVASAEEKFNNQVDKKTHSVDTSHSLPTATTVIDQWTYKPSGHGGRGEACAYMLSNMYFH